MNQTTATKFLERISRNEIIKRIQKDADILFARPKGTHYEQEKAKLIQEAKDAWNDEWDDMEAMG